MLREEIVKEWNSLKGQMFSCLTADELVKETMIESYEQKLKKKQLVIEGLEEDLTELRREQKDFISYLTKLITDLRLRSAEKVKERITAVKEKFLFKKDENDKAVVDNSLVRLFNSLEQVTDFIDELSKPTIQEVD